MKSKNLLVFCHLVGDYVLQSDFIAKTKGSNWYHLFVHCAMKTFCDNTMQFGEVEMR